VQELTVGKEDHGKIEVTLQACMWGEGGWTSWDHEVDKRKECY
jgi:hypothetical protein